jgi:glycerate kinase
VAPDSFKGSLSAREVADAIARGLKRTLPGVTVRARPMADGGEGTVDAVLGGGGERRRHVVTGASGRRRDAMYGMVNRPEGLTAVVEVAEVVGITDGDGTSAPIDARSTRGVGELLRALLDAGLRRVMIGLGGSSTNDGGAGMLATLGARFLDEAGRPVDPTPAGLARLATVDARDLDPRLRACAITILSDVTNPLCGNGGASAVFGPQKGLRPEEVASVDAVLARYAALTERALGAAAAGAAAQPGAGAAGGLGFAARALGGAFASGAQVIADLIGLDEALEDADWAITGEGKSDGQTLSGKAPFVVAERARDRGVPVTLLSGALDDSALGALGDVFAGCFALPCRPMSLDACIAGADRLLADRAAALGALWRRLPAARPAR